MQHTGQAQSLNKQGAEIYSKVAKIRKKQMAGLIIKKNALLI